MKKNAFTLTEILISLGIIGVMMALSVSIVKPREIHYKYQVQQAQKTLNEALREAILRTNYTDHRFPKADWNNFEPVMQLCRGLNETMNTTLATSSIGNSSVANFGEANIKPAEGRGGCKIRALNGMTFYIWGPSGNGKPICRHYIKQDDAGRVIADVPVASYVVFVDIDGNGRYYSASKSKLTKANETLYLGNLPAFWIDEDYNARVIPVGTDLPSVEYLAGSCHM